ncbi:glycosyltransferase family 2 protein [Dokdonia ponticola]|uniref:Glycosyltransferase family 2 protein n=1 Tax=Dokdonia ponticola TaxID=2041041 RepID=A0ABV9HWQ6_9FLAO
MLVKDNIWVFLPAYNEATVIRDIIKNLKSCGYTNIVVVDDGSTDNTNKFAQEEKVHIIRLCLNRGVGAATRAAILYAKRKSIEFLVLMDADGQHYPSEIEKLVNELQKQKADIVIGSRFLEKKSKIPTSRIIYNKIAYMFTYFGKSTITDSQSGFRLLNKVAINNLNLELDEYGICTEMVWKANAMKLTIVETPIMVQYTKYSQSKGQSLWKGIQTAYHLIKNRLYEH